MTRQEQAVLLQCGASVSVLQGDGRLHRQLISIGSSRSCTIVRIEIDDFERACELVCQADQQAQSLGHDLVLVQDCEIARQVSDRLSFAPCGLFYSWSWSRFWKALEVDLSFGSTSMLPWFELQIDQDLVLTNLCLPLNSTGSGRVLMILEERAKRLGKKLIIPAQLANKHALF